MKKAVYLFLSVIFLMPFYGEDINFFVRSTYANAQFWQRIYIVETGEKNPYYSGTSQTHKVMENRSLFANFMLGSIGAGMEWIIWDMGKKRGSRLFLKSGIDYIFYMSHTHIGHITEKPYSIDTKGSGQYTLNTDFKHAYRYGYVAYTGAAIDIFVGGTFPKTDLIWGLGSIFHFVFPFYSSQIGVDNFAFYRRFNFFATPCILLGYDIFIPNTKFKFTPQTRVGVTCNPLIPFEIIDEMNYYTTGLKYSGLYVDFSIAFSFFSVQWKK